MSGKSAIFSTTADLMPLFHYSFCSLDLTHIFLYKNSKQVIDNDGRSGPMQVCCKASVILITRGYETQQS